MRKKAISNYVLCTRKIHSKFRNEVKLQLQDWEKICGQTVSRTEQTWVYLDKPVPNSETTARDKIGPCIIIYNPVHDVGLQL